jgi:hypothetical protein
MAVVAMLLITGLAAAEEFDATITDPSRAFTKRKNMPEVLVYGKLTLDSQGKVVSTSYREGVVTKATKVAMGVFDEKKKKWTPGEAIEGGIGADLFTEKGKVLRLRLTVGNDGKTISQILVTQTDDKPELADAEFDALLKQIGPQTNGNGGVAYTRLELDGKGNVIKTLPLKTGRVTADTKVVLGKYNEKEKTWEAGEAIPSGLYGDVFKDIAARPVPVRITMRDDRKGIAQILVRPVGKK